MSKMTARRLWLNIHLYIALTLGVGLVVVAVTGSILVWHDAVERTLEPQRYAVSGTDPVLAPSAYLKAGAEALGDVAPSTLRLPAEPGDPVTVAGPTRTLGLNGRPQMMTAWLDPATGCVLDVANSSQSFTALMHQLHGRLLIPEVGRQIVGWTGVFMLVLALSGIYLWWPRGGIRFTRALGWRKGLKTTTNLHHLFGIWISIPLAVLSFTGIYISFPQTSRAVLAVFTDVGPQAPRMGGGGMMAGGKPKTETQIAIDDAVARAAAKAGGAPLVAVSLPTDKSAEWRIQFRKADAPQPLTITVDDATGAVKGADNRKTAPGAGDATARLMRKIHDGTDMGIVWQVIIFVGGLLPLLFMITGVTMWLRRRRFERDRAGRRAAAPQAA